jgi:biotin carboxylase
LPSSHKVLVVGTTADYIDWIRRTRPREALFLTDPVVRRTSTAPPPAPDEELQCDLTDHRQACRLTGQFLAAQRLTLAGIACFDCESMELAAVLAEHFRLPYPTVQAIRNCRDKFQAKKCWQQNHLDTPAAAIVDSEEAAEGFFNQSKRPIVLKPSGGSGSELVFACDSAALCRHNYRLIRQGLDQRQTHRLYAGAPRIMAEGLAAGREYSCDFAIQDGRAHLIRMTRKIKAGTGPFGTTQGYLLQARRPEEMEAQTLRRTLAQSALALGIEEGICMLDFMMDGSRMVLLELAPRPGGDCLPQLMRQARQLDMLQLQLDFSRRTPLPPLAAYRGAPLVALRVLSRQAGTLKKIHADALQGDRRVRELDLMRKPGHRMALPPEDYDSWLLGHLIFAPDDRSDVETQCRELLDKIIVEVA